MLTCKQQDKVRGFKPYQIVFLICLSINVKAQHVIYSPFFNSKSLLRFQIIGKSGDYYWAEKLQKAKYSGRKDATDIPPLLSIDLFNAKLELLNETQTTAVPGVQKQWLLAGNKGLDQLFITNSFGNTKVICRRYFADENITSQTRLLDSLPFSVRASRYILVRSEDHSKNLLVIFENSDEEFTKLHALLFDSDWNPIYNREISHKEFSMPCIQDDELGFPSESFDNLPIKLANNGEWLMVSPSFISRNFSLFHVCEDGSEYYFREIPVSIFYRMEDIAMSIDNDLREASVGLLSAYAKTTFKNAAVYKYSMKEGIVYFDSSYHFNSQNRDIQNKNLTHESFIALKGGGFMYLKEYGSPFEFEKPKIPFMTNWETAYLMASYSGTARDADENKQTYILTRGLSPIPVIRKKGDLNLFYFPGVSSDSTWTGVLNMEQHTESNNPDLSYLLIPEQNNLYIVYNSTDGYDDPLATATTLNMKGQSTEDALVFWKMNKLLNFQLSHRFSADEVSVPYSGNQQGFAVIRLR